MSIFDDTNVKRLEMQVHLSNIICLNFQVSGAPKGSFSWKKLDLIKEADYIEPLYIKEIFLTTSRAAAGWPRDGEKKHIFCNSRRAYSVLITDIVNKQPFCLYN